MPMPTCILLGHTTQIHKESDLEERMKRNGFISKSGMIGKKFFDMHIQRTFEQTNFGVRNYYYYYFDMPFINPKSLSLLLFLVHYTLASDESNPLITPQSQDPSSSAINFPHDDASNINSLVASGWTTTTAAAAPVDLGNTSDNPIDQQQDVFLPADDNTVVACTNSAPSSQDVGNSPIPGRKRRRSRRLLRKRDPPGFCRSEDYYKDNNAPSSSSGGGSTTTTPTTRTNQRPGRPPGEKKSGAQPLKIPKAMPLLGDPNSPLCNQYFPSVGSNYAVCYYPYFKTIQRSPLVHMLSPCRACKYFFPPDKLLFFKKRNTRTHSPRPHPPSKKEKTPVYN